jgi:hypothetical protein
VKRPAISCLITACCLLASAPARADSCDHRFGGSCRSESTATIVRIKGEAAGPMIRRSRVTRVKQSRTENAQRWAKRRLATRSPVQEQPFSEPAVVNAARAASNPTRIVDEGFNTLAADDYLDPLLEQALMKVRQQMLGSALP